MKLKRPLKHCKLSQMQFFYWDELPEQDESDIIGGSSDPLFLWLQKNTQSKRRILNTTKSGVGKKLLN